MKKPFCDLCGEPAMEIPFTHLTFKREIQNRHGYHLTVEFTEATKNFPSTRDEQADICNACMANGLRAIAKRLDSEALAD